jgi:hypothetical protein
MVIYFLIEANKNSFNKKKSITDQNYRKSIETACKDLNLKSDHYVHFGRSVGQNYGEIVAELDAEVMFTIKIS